MDIKRQIRFCIGMTDDLRSSARLPLEALRVFEAATRWRNFSAAGRELGVTQAAPGWTEVRFAPEFETLRHAAGKVATPFGPIAVAWRTPSASTAGRSSTITVPMAGEL